MKKVKIKGTNKLIGVKEWKSKDSTKRPYPKKPRPKTYIA